MKNVNLLLLTCMVLLATSCLKDVDELTKIKGVTGSPTLAIPLVNAEASIADLSGKISDKASVEADPNGLLSLYFRDKDSLPEDQYFTLPPVNFDLGIIMPPNEVPNFVNTGFYSNTVDTVAPISMSGNTRMERVLIKDGLLNLTVGSTFQHDVKFKITYPGITKNGIPLSDSFSFTYTGSTQPNINHPINIDGYTVDFTNNGSTYNAFPIQAKLDITRVAPNGVNLTDHISISQNLTVNEYSRVEGYFGKFTITNFKQTNILGVFDKKIDGSLYLNDPKLMLTIDNSFGMPITAKITDMYVLSGGGNKIPIIINQFKDTFSLEYTTNIGQSKVTPYVIDKTNSNIDVVLSSAPQEITYEVTFYANYDDIVTTNVLYDYTTVKQEAKLVLPFDMKVINYAIEAQGEFTLGQSLKDMEKSGFTINWAEIKSDLINDMPMNAIVQMYVEDTLTNTVVDSIFDPAYFITGAEVDANGAIVNPTRESVVRMIDKTRVENLKRGNKYRLQVTLRTSANGVNQPFVKFFDTQKLRVKLGIRANSDVKL